MTKKPRGHQILKKVLLLLTAGPATSYDLCKKLGIKPQQLAQRLTYWRRYGWIEVVSHTRTYYRGITPVYAVPDPQTVVAIQRLYGDAELPKHAPQRQSQWCDDEDLEWMRAHQASQQQKQQMRSRV